jgi:hypothetical protein
MLKLHKTCQGPEFGFGRYIFLGCGSWGVLCVALGANREFSLFVSLRAVFFVDLVEDGLKNESIFFWITGPTPGISLASCPLVIAIEEVLIPVAA